MKINTYKIKTIALEKKPITTEGGMCVLPDLDFLPAIDLADIDASTTALIVLPGGNAWKENRNKEIESLIDHGISNHIPIAAMGSAANVVAQMSLLQHRRSNSGLNYLKEGRDFNEHTACIITSKIRITRDMTSYEFADAISDILSISESPISQNWFRRTENRIEVD